MCFLFRKLKRITPLASLSVILFIFSGCSLLQSDFDNTTSVSFRFSSARSILSGSSDIFLDVELKGDYEELQTLPVESEEAQTVIFEAVPLESEVYAAAQVYTFYEDKKVVLCEGKSETKTIEEGENTLKLKLAYNNDNIVDTKLGSMILYPLFTAEATNRKLKSHKIEFNQEKNEEKFQYKINNLQNFQKIRITYKAVSEKEGSFNLTFINTQSGESVLCNDNFAVTSQPVKKEVDIPQGIAFDSIRIEKVQDPAANTTMPDFTCAIEKIELIIMGAIGLTITIPENQVINVSQDNTTNSVKFTAPEGYTSYVWKVNGVVQTEVTGNVFEFSTISINTGYYDITLFADTETLHHSWNGQIEKL